MFARGTATELNFSAMAPQVSGMASVGTLMDGLVDYAGLFPPAAEEMREALENYAKYVAGNDASSLGRFIVPVTRLEELEREAADRLPHAHGDAWRLSALIGDDIPTAIEKIHAFNRRHGRGSNGGKAVIDVVELKAASVDSIVGLKGAIPDSLTSYIEVPVLGDIDALVSAIARIGARAKIRTGGVTPEAFPSARAVIDFIVACRRAGVPFKATAGLHHPLRGEYRLTYEPNSPRGTMYGYLNVFLAAALLDIGAERDVAATALEESDPDSFAFSDDAIEWRGRRLTRQQLAHSRKFAISFGSCSFREPIDELAQLTRLTGHHHP